MNEEEIKEKRKGDKETDLSQLKLILFRNLKRDGEGGKENLGICVGGETIIRIYCMRKESIFNKRKTRNE